LTFLLTGALTTACQSVAMQPTEVSSEAVLLTMPMVPQDELYECGLATMSALCQYYERTIPPEERAALVETASREEGLSGAELRAALVAAGFEVYLFPGTLDHEVSGLYRHVDLGRPLLVMISPDRESKHYCLFTGYDPVHGNVFLLDPRRGSLVITAASFASLWNKAQSFTLLAMPYPERLTASVPSL
jgi:ABC-type bacteriocin/lantibiotic exporter with double-glycine peptidase domain